MNRLKLAIIGYGNRGTLYTKYILDQMDYVDVVAVVDYKEERVTLAKKNFPDTKVFKTADDYFAANIPTDVVIICSMDSFHYTQTIKALNQNSHVILEKPIALNIQECLDLQKIAYKKNLKVLVTHVLRYTLFYSKIKELIKNGTIGKVTNINQSENVGYWHMAHSYIRGNWANSKNCGPMILTKCSHDLDIIGWLIDKEAVSVSSYGDLSYFKAENAPVNSGQHCHECEISENCPYNCYKFYLDFGREWMRSIIGDNLSDENIVNRLKNENSNYSKCVFKCDNNVVDHQVVNLLFKDNVTASLNMNAFSRYAFREIHIYGTLGEIIGNFEKQVMTLNIFNEESRVIDLNKITTDFESHGGGDKIMFYQMLDHIMNNRYFNGLTSLDDSILSHTLAFAAEESRLNNGQVIDIKEYCNLNTTK